MARLDAAWFNFSKRGQAWDHFWQDAAQAGGGGVSGTLSVTLAAVLLAGTGAVSVSGTGAATLDLVTLSGTGSIAVAGTGAETLGAVTLSGTGTVGSGGGPPAWERRLSGRSLGRRGRGLVR